MALLVTHLKCGESLPMAWASAAANPIFLGISRRVAPRMGAAIKSQTLSLLRGLEPGGKKNIPSGSKHPGDYFLNLYTLHSFLT